MDVQPPLISPYRPTVLLVDDEESILNSLRRLLRGQPYDVKLATSGEQALAQMAEGPVDLVMSDARMPGMDGATLLAQINQHHPSTVRILLTGYADPSAIIKAVNDGQIHRYISKPWNDDELLMTLRQALDHQHSERERQRLELLARRQNAQLRLLNNDLEKRVAARTAELQQTADMLDLAYEELKHSYVTGTEVFSMLANLRLPPAKQTNRQIIELVRCYCRVHALDEAISRDLAMAAALYNIGKLSWPDSMIVAPSDQLMHGDRDRYRDYPRQSEALLMTLEPMKDAARLILHHQEHWDGSGFPDRLKGEAIPFGARLLKLAVDFVELQRGLILERQMNSDEALLYLHKYAGRLYDPALLEYFVQVCASLHSDLTLVDPEVQVCTTRDLAPGMVLARNLNADNGMLLLNAGKVLSAALVEKLVAFESMEGGKYCIFVRVPSNDPITPGRSDLAPC
ncbi:response regulator [Pseudomonas putida]|uniref:HD domain-containing phosphohydrolase n=1 Tax=Pseudomonas putida TaxID=303 RepID=UPI0002E2BCE7|nr:HD domain-containing phosphohydrolase [Pseudomonas putida]ANC82036.1 two-component system response regulator [Pseudomonas putida B6-2]ULL07187.1 response regulator [Pseudomonas putida]